MEWLDVDTELCPVQRTLDVAGEKWTFLILRDAMNGVRRFDEFRRHLGVSEAVLSGRLRKLVDVGILRTEAYQEPGMRERFEYRLTRKGWDLWPALVALRQWGDVYAGVEEGPVLDLRHKECGGEVRVVVECVDGHGELAPRDVVARPGVGARVRERRG
ncbi:winged helix-turn-helix transcriptional regulator [Streptomyces acidiscabies]|uniref:Helix-turn-helix domain-containing protein n=1 Tax=Streptomyces acidiscabies TaxID=42234 RepID=A0A0L0K5M7_9ACTN|nr:helix-turn-helix domain-containing protein [Streptomyces acidiscabies]KND33141.1 transcriptional regulator [Streptomyces acidiscabies]MBZ3916009.1 helix-turn-helix transcriptional regulator [Streptomyces acidiscabies]MDX2960401.1 helix-turn-helix domain-containing protein [Streptomyces acidiscabies]MDX3023825.1 helix-turn-helix domain-containing protein [Streptomyces acidiscabies]MDX3794384.1 helix-turn-helix domain-containing protein [Streptomyces acidiscabies]